MHPSNQATRLGSNHKTFSISQNEIIFMHDAVQDIKSLKMIHFCRGEMQLNDNIVPIIFDPRALVSGEVAVWR